MSYRELWVLLNRLPQESWTQTALRDKDPEGPLVAPERGEQKFGPWALTNHQLADLRDAVRRLEYVSAVAGQLTPAPKPPEPTPQPGVKRAVRKQSAENVVYLNSLRAPRGA